MSYPIQINYPLERTIRYYDSKGNKIEESEYWVLFAEAEKTFKS